MYVSYSPHFRTRLLWFSPDFFAMSECSTSRFDRAFVAPSLETRSFVHTHVDDHWHWLSATWNTLRVMARRSQTYILSMTFRIVPRQVPKLVPPLALVFRQLAQPSWHGWCFIEMSDRTAIRYNDHQYMSHSYHRRDQQVCTIATLPSSGSI